MRAALARNDELDFEDSLLNLDRTAFAAAAVMELSQTPAS